MSARHPPSITLPGTSNRPGTPTLDECQTPVQYKRATNQQLRYASEKAERKQTTAQRKCTEDFDKKVRFWVEVQPNDQVYNDRPPRRVQRSKSETTDLLK